MKDGFIKVAAASVKVTVGDVESNEAAMLKAVRNAAAEGVKLIVFPELSLTAYTCSDLFHHRALTDAAMEALLDFAEKTSGLDILSVLGLPVVCADKLYNCAAFVCGGRLLGLVPKTNIPNYCEFYELRHFSPAPEEMRTFNAGGYDIPFGTRQLFVCRDMPSLRVAAEVCEDLWVSVPPSCAHAAAGATVIVNLSASDETIGKEDYRRSLVLMQSAKLVCGYLYADAGEGESSTDLVFAGHDLIGENGTLLDEKRPFEPAKPYAVSELDLERLTRERERMNTFVSAPAGYTTTYFSLRNEETKLTRYIDPRPFVPSDAETRARRAELILNIQSRGLTQRLERSFSKKAVVAISGGLDSCLALLVTVRAFESLGRDRKDIVTVSMPCFGTTKRTKSNAETLCRELGTDFRTIDITDSVKRHFADIGHDMDDRNVVFENAQARERTQVIMDIANGEGGIVVGTGDLSEVALGWSTYNGDHMSMYGVNASVPKTLVRHIVAYCADVYEKDGKKLLSDTLRDILATPVSPELLPAKGGEIAQKTEDIVGPYELHDFFLYNMLRHGFSPRKLYRLATAAFDGVYDRATVKKWLCVFIRRFFTQQFKRSCMPDGPKVGSVALSPRGDFRMPSDASYRIWLEEAENIDAR